MHSEALSPPPLRALKWDLFCRVVDNLGDIGVCWRLARRLASLGQHVRLWCDDSSALSWMAPQGASGVIVLPWREPHDGEMPGDAVIEAFGCDPPAGFVERMARAPRSPVWVDLEYLSAEAYVERSHALPSPQFAGPGRGLNKWFFYPGFTSATGGLLREAGLASERAGFDAAAWLAGVGIGDLPGARRVSLFCYEQPALQAWLAQWRAESTQLLVTPGLAARQVSAALACDGEPGSTAVRDGLEAHFLPWLPQPEFDRLLWSCDLNLVRGEDSLVRALWAGKPFLWQLYAQQGGAQAAKLDAFLDFYLQGADAVLSQHLRRHFAQCNGLLSLPRDRQLTVATTQSLPLAQVPSDAEAWRTLAALRCARLEAAMELDGDLALRLCRFVAAKG
ncbi:MAG: elongation factor P maturation arginine rhamnosyltransferase EarP [Methylibium sp.]|nr:elongation factor P maturation arginine rhamnosyltransferase EarP [Methylibium sp.]MBA2722818.1 elongation factor P maturation arginine rhamnosyltransferase EarP [Methylibium sp.]MBA3598715.1 elongation factor P maturation arginine rhamnosyltransferase EarP [Methylibium sp.]